MPAKSNDLKVWVNYQYASESHHSPISAPIWQEGPSELSSSTTHMLVPDIWDAEAVRMFTWDPRGVTTPIPHQVWSQTPHETALSVRIMKMT